MIKAVWREEWSEVHELRDELEEAGLRPPHVREVSTERENAVRELRKFLKATRRSTQGKQRTENLLQSGGKSAAAQERKLRAATKREINAVMERPPRTTIDSLATGRGDDVEVLTDPVEVARECCEFGTRRMGSMQPKWFRQLDVAEGHRIWAVVQGEVLNGTVAAIDDDGHYSLTCDCGKKVTAVKRSELCLEWQMDADSAACEITVTYRRQQIGEECMAGHVDDGSGAFSSPR